MFKTIVNKLLMSLYFVAGTLILELVTFNMLDMGYMPDHFLYNFAIILSVAFFVFVIPNYKAQFIIYTVFLTIQTIFIYVNYSLVKIYGDLFSFEMFRLIDEAGVAVTNNFVYLSVILQLVGTYLAITILGSFLYKYCRKDKIDMKVHFSIFNVVIILSLQLISLGYYINIRTGILNTEIVIGQDYTSNMKLLMQTSLLKSKSYKTFGTYGYFSNLIINEFSETDGTMQSMAVDYFNQGKIYGKGENMGELFGVDSGNNVIVIMMESVEWFSLGDGTYDKTRQNLSYELTPNIYSIIYGSAYKQDYLNINKYDDSLVAVNNFAKSKTNISEAIGIMGNYPIGKDLNAVVGDKNYGDNTPLSYAMPYVLSKNGYTTSYVHSNQLGFYSRNKTHRNFGFQNVIGTGQIVDKNGKLLYGNGPAWDHWIAEGDFVRNAIDFIIPQNCQTKPFYTFYLNVSTHGAYTESANRFDEDALRYYDYVMYGPENCYIDINGNYKKIAGRNTYSKWFQNVLNNYSDGKTINSLASQLVYYQCGVCGLDEAIGVMLNKLKEYGVQDKTTFVLYSDHNAYYNDLSNKLKGVPDSERMDIELNSLPMIISSPGVKNYNRTSEVKYRTYERFCSAYDIVPTIFDLLGIQYNENLYLGQSLFNKTEYEYEVNGQTYDLSVYYSHTGGIFGQHIITSDFVDYKTTPGVTDEAIEWFEIVSNEMLMKMNYLGILNDSKLHKKLKTV